MRPIILRSLVIVATSYVTLTRACIDSFIRDMTDSHLTCDMSHSYVTSLIHMWHVSFICDIADSYVIRGVTHFYVTWCNQIDFATLTSTYIDSFIRDMTVPHEQCDMSHSYAICDMTHSFVTWLIHLWYVACLTLMWNDAIRSITPRWLAPALARFPNATPVCMCVYIYTCI